MSEAELVRVAQALYDPADLADVDAFEANPPSMKELLAEVARLAEVTGFDATSIDGEATARRTLLEMAANPDDRARLEPLLERVREETMSSPGETVVLVVIVLAALKDIVELEVDNQGKKGARRWRLRIGGRRGNTLGETARSGLQTWLTRVVAPPAQLPEAQWDAPAVSPDRAQGQKPGSSG